MKIYKAGIDIGSTTVKLVLLDEKDNMVFGHLITAGEGVLPGFYEKHGFSRKKEVILMGREL